MAVKIKKRNRGRPDRVGRLFHSLQVNVLKGQEDMMEAYPKAIALLIDTMNSDTASPTNRLSAAKTIKEYVEETLEIMEQEDSEQEADEEDSKQSEPIFKIG